MQLQDNVTSQGHIAASLQQPRKHVITQKHNLHTSFVITPLQQTQTKAASKKVFINYKVQLKGEGGLNNPITIIGIFYLFTAWIQVVQMTVFINF